MPKEPGRLVSLNSPRRGGQVPEPGVDDLRFWERAANAPESASEEDRAFYIELAGLLVQRQDPLPFYGSVVGTLL